MRPAFHLPVPSVPSNTDWTPDYPNPPDLRFDYYKLMSDAAAASVPIGYAPASKPRVAVIGAGVAGLTAARELYRCGYGIVVYEATDRICGRQYSYRVDGQITAMELGAMRFPFFPEFKASNCLSAYYLRQEANATAHPFPNPGSTSGGTGIYINEGYGPEKYPSTTPELIKWQKSDVSPNPPENTALREVYMKMYEFQQLVTGIVGKAYTGDAWTELWKAIANNYEQMSFGDLVFTPALTSEYADDGWFGGLGMDEQQSDLFYTIGAGDGSWGAFYEVGAMWFLRCVMFGFSTNLQSVIGIEDKSGLQHYGERTTDSAGAYMGTPYFWGIQSLGEWLMYQPAPGSTLSLYDEAHVTLEGRVTVFINTPATKIEQLSTGKLAVTTPRGIDEVDYVVVTPTIWSLQTSVDFINFSPSQLPWEVLRARGEQHNISSCKVFFPLKEPYWLAGSGIPQILVTDTIVQDAYGIQWSPDDPGVLLASYTWEDDALKVLAYDENSLAELMLATLDEVTSRTVNAKISDYVDQTQPVIIHWLNEEYFHGCAKFYRQRNWVQNYALLTYNQMHSADSGIYFAGESYSVEGGWSEPALRTAIDAVIHLVNNSKGTFSGAFTFEDYPKYDTEFRPNQIYPRNS